MSMLHLLAALMQKTPPVKELTQKGYGHVYDTGETSDLSMSYANVDNGSAPSENDLVVWCTLSGGYSNTAEDLSGSGWTQGTATETFAGTRITLFAKVVAAGDLSSPPKMIATPTAGSIGFWVAYSVSGTIASLAVAGLAIELGGNSAPSNQAVDSSALNSPNVAIMIGAGGGDDGTPNISKTGATPDISFSSAANQWLGNVAETKFIVNAIVGGESATYSKSDDGASNHMASGYVSVTFA